MRDCKITRKEGEWYNVKVTDSYGRQYQNHFETAHEVNKWIYYIWKNESKSVDEHELLHMAILNCKEIDKNNNNLRKIL